VSVIVSHVVSVIVSHVVSVIVASRRVSDRDVTSCQ
jgi:hypothetical protein